MFKMKKDEILIRKENEELENEIKVYKQKLIDVDREIQIQLNNIEQYDLDKQMIIQEIRKLLLLKENQFEKRIKSIIEKLPCQIEEKSLQSLTKSIIQKGIGVLNDLNYEYKNAYNEDYRDSKIPKYQSLFESFFIIGVKHKQFSDLKQNNLMAILKPKILYKQYKQGMNIEERALWVACQKDIKEYFQNNLIIVEKLFDHSEIEILTSRCLQEQDVLQENSFVFNLKGPSFNQQVPKNIELLTSFNRNHQLFVFVQGVDDYITSFQDDGFQYWKCKKYFCFLTYFPIPEIFDQLLKFANNLIKVHRLDAIRKHKENIKKRKLTQQEIGDYNDKIFQDIDAVNINYKAEKDINKSINLLLEQYLDFDKPILNVKLKSDLLENSLNYSLPIPQINLNNPENLRKARQEIIVHNRVNYTHVVLQIFNFDNFFKIFQEILKEGQILFYCPNIYILTSVCYFFHQLIYPFVWHDPAIYYSNSETLNLLINETSIILGINSRFINSQQDQNLLKNSKLMIVEIKIRRKKDGQNVSAVIHQHNTSRAQLSLKSLLYFDIKQIIDNYTIPESNYQATCTLEQVKKCKEFLYSMIQLIQTDFIQNIIPDKDPCFINNGWNELLIKEVIKNKVKKDQEFIINHIFESKYFQYYLKQQYNYQENQQ